MRFMARTASSLLASLLFLSPLATAVHAQTAPAAAGAKFAIDQQNSTVTYKAVHKLHTVTGVSKQVEGGAQILPDGKVQVMVRVPTSSFDSGNSQRDAHVKESLSAASNQYITLKAISEGVTVPTTFPTTVEKTFKGQLEFHGVKQSIDVPVKIVFESATQARATAAFQVSMEAYKVERPSLLLVKVDDGLKMEVSIAFKA